MSQNKHSTIPINKNTQQRRPQTQQHLQEFNQNSQIPQFNNLKLSKKSNQEILQRIIFQASPNKCILLNPSQNNNQNRTSNTTQNIQINNTIPLINAITPTSLGPANLGNQVELFQNKNENPEELVPPYNQNPGKQIHSEQFQGIHSARRRANSKFILIAKQMKLAAMGCTASSQTLLLNNKQCLTSSNSFSVAPTQLSHTTAISQICSNNSSSSPEYHVSSSQSKQQQQSISFSTSYSPKRNGGTMITRRIPVKLNEDCNFSFLNQEVETATGYSPDQITIMASKTINNHSENNIKANLQLPWFPTINSKQLSLKSILEDTQIITASTNDQEPCGEEFAKSAEILPFQNILVRAGWSGGNKNTQIQPNSENESPFIQISNHSKKIVCNTEKQSIGIDYYKQQQQRQFIQQEQELNQISEENVDCGQKIVVLPQNEPNEERIMQQDRANRKVILSSLKLSHSLMNSGITQSIIPNKIPISKKCFQIRGSSVGVRKRINSRLDQLSEDVIVFHQANNDIEGISQGLSSQHTSKQNNNLQNNFPASLGGKTVQADTIFKHNKPKSNIFEQKIKQIMNRSNSSNNGSLNQISNIPLNIHQNNLSSIDSNAPENMQYYGVIGFGQRQNSPSVLKSFGTVQLTPRRSTSYGSRQNSSSKVLDLSLKQQVMRMMNGSLPLPLSHK